MITFCLKLDFLDSSWLMGGLRRLVNLVFEAQEFSGMFTQSSLSSSFRDSVGLNRDVFGLQR